MENNQLLDQESLMHSFSNEELNLLFSYFNEKYNDQTIIRRLQKKGYEPDHAQALLSEARKRYQSYIFKKKAQNDMIFGGLWFVGGSVATLANIGAIFYGAIAFGMIQFFKGLFNYKNG